MRSAVEQRRSVTVTSESARRSTSSQPDGRAEAAVAAPVDEDRLLGAISVTTDDERRRFALEDAELLEVLAGLAAATIVGHEEARLEGRPALGAHGPA